MNIKRNKKRENNPRIFNRNLNRVKNFNNNNLIIIQNENQQKRKKVLKIKKRKNKLKKGKKAQNNKIITVNPNNIINNNGLLKNQKRKTKTKKETPYNDNEMNSFNYEEAKKKDNRSYCQYYISLLKTKHILIFSFCQHCDYNSQFIKIYIFFFTFSINYLVSAMFYSDDTMHKIYVDEGSFDFTYQLPQMFYSFIISTILQALLNILGLYENNIIIFRKSQQKELNIEKALFKIRCKIALFFIINYILLFFFWVYLGCFCAVYKNTQIHLLLDVASSFGISFISPIFIYLLPGMFRIPSLKGKVNRPLMFRFSQLLQLL